MFFTFIMDILVFLVILTILVLIHEAGHYIMAKKFGIKVEEFGFGIPPRLWGKKKGETIYSINWLPIGGFVKLFGEDEAGAGRVSVGQEKSIEKGDLQRAYFSKPIWQRATVIFAGVIMNALLAAVIYYVFLGISGFKTDLPLIGNYHSFFGVNQKVTSEILINEVAKNSPAGQTGIMPNVKIVAVNGQPVTDANAFIKTIDADKGKQITLSWQNVQTGRMVTSTITPRANPPKGQGALGIQFFPLDTVTLSYDSPAQKLFSGFIHPANLMVYNFAALKSFIGISVQEKTISPLRQTVSGPVGIGFIVGAVVNIPDMKERVMSLLNLAGLLSAALAVFNVLPIPGLDGGRLFFIIIEAVTQRKINPRIEASINAVGIMILIGLMFLVTINDLDLHKSEILGFFKHFLH